MKQKETMKKDKNKVWITVISVVLGGTIAILLDRFIDISFSPLQDVAEVVYSTITVIAGIWITCYLLFLELFKDRYPVEDMKSEQLPHMGNIFILLFFLVILIPVLCGRHSRIFLEQLDKRRPFSLLYRVQKNLLSHAW